MLAKALAEQGSNVTLVDIDVAGYISSTANIRVNGLLAQSVDGGHHHHMHGIAKYK